MSEFIKEFGKDNFIVMLVIVALIVLVLIAIVFLEKRNSKKVIRNEINNIDKNGVEQSNSVNSNNNTVTKEVVIHDNVIQDSNDVEHLDEVEDVVYYESDTTIEEAKEKLEEVTKRLIDDNPSNLIDHTNFENEQEEKSIISYEELIRASHDIDQKNDKLLEDEGEAAITIEELYKKHQEEQSIQDGIDAVNEKVQVTNPVFEEEPKKFKNSDVISPVFGIYTGEVKPKAVLEEMDKEIGPKDLEEEIQRTEDFLEELKRLKNRLD
ncbi:MAG: hypothetical protein IJL74_03755 [Bacilli bacterium]|nr:hypothetical protein [Bacilli bacterium]